MKEYTKAETNRMYSEAYDAGVDGKPLPNITGLEGEPLAAVEYGWARGKSIKAECDRANSEDPSGPFLTRMTVANMKWKF